jgi:hypothetical protein
VNHAPKPVRGSPGLGIVIDIVAAAMPQENASCPFQPPNEVESLHATSNSSTFRIPGICSELNVWYKSFKWSFRSSKLSPCVQ